MAVGKKEKKEYYRVNLAFESPDPAEYLKRYAGMRGESITQCVETLLQGTLPKGKTFKDKLKEIEKLAGK